MTCRSFFGRRFHFSLSFRKVLSDEARCLRPCDREVPGIGFEDAGFLRFLEERGGSSPAKDA